MKDFEKIRETIGNYERLLKILEDHEDNNRICKLSKKEITALYGLSYTGTCKKLGFLMKYELVKRVDGGFLRMGKKVVEDTPLSLISKILLLVREKPEVYDSFKLQAELLNVKMDDIQTAWGFYSYFFGSKYPKEEELVIVRRIETYSGGTQETIGY